MKHFIQYLTEDSDQIIRDNSTKIQKRMLDNGFSVPAPDVHNHFKNLPTIIALIIFGFVYLD